MEDYDPRRKLDTAELRTYVEQFDDLRVAIRETYTANPKVILSVSVEFDNYRIVYAMGSVDLILTAITEGLRYIAPLFVPNRSYVSITLQSMGTRE